VKKYLECKQKIAKQIKQMPCFGLRKFEIIKDTTNSLRTNGFISRYSKDTKG